MVPLTLLALAACERAAKPAAQPAAPVAAAPTNDSASRALRPTILFIGTSLTAGLGLDPGQSYPDVIARKLDSLGENYEVVNAGVSGETSADARHRLDWLLKRPAGVIVLETGANDGLRGLDVDSMRANLIAIIDTIRARQPQAKILLVGMEALPNMSKRYADRFRAAFPAVAKETHVAFLPFLLAGVAGVDTLNQGDGIHPNVRGAELVAAHVMPALLPLLGPAKER